MTDNELLEAIRARLDAMPVTAGLRELQLKLDGANAACNRVVASRDQFREDARNATIVAEDYRRERDQALIELRAADVCIRQLTEQRDRAEADYQALRMDGIRTARSTPAYIRHT